MTFSITFGFALLLSIGPGFGCGDHSPATHAVPDASAAPSARVFVGTVEQSDAEVAVVALGQKARVYFCGGAASYASFTRWLNVEANAAHHVELQPDKPGDFMLDATLLAGELRGTVAATDGVPHDFDAKLVPAHTIAGLYEASSDCGKVGLIVTQTKAQAKPAGQGACIPSSGDPAQQVNPLSPLARAKDGTIDVELAGSDQPILVRAAKPPG